MSYGQLPRALGTFEVDCKEMMFFQYLPIKFPGDHTPVYEERLAPFNGLIGAVCCDYIGAFGLDSFMSQYVYITAKRLFQTPGCSFNRPGYHSDGFMTCDINYIWSDCAGTIFNDSRFMITPDDNLSLVEMEQQALSVNERRYPDGSLLCLNQYCIHKVQDVPQPMMRTFLKVSFSQDRYDLEGNSHNHLLDYNWEMRQRKAERNIPQTINQ